VGWERNKRDRHEHPLLSTQVPQKQHTTHTSLRWIESMKARHAGLCNEFWHSCEHSNITNSTTELLFLKRCQPCNRTSSSNNNYSGVMKLHAGGSVLNFYTRSKLSISVSQYITQHKSHKLKKKPATCTVFRKCATAFNVYFLLIAMCLTELAHFY